MPGEASALTRTRARGCDAVRPVADVQLLTPTSACQCTLVGAGCAVCDGLADPPYPGLQLYVRVTGGSPPARPIHPTTPAPPPLAPAPTNLTLHLCSFDDHTCAQVNDNGPNAALKADYNTQLDHHNSRYPGVGLMPPQFNDILSKSWAVFSGRAAPIILRAAERCGYVTGKFCVNNNQYTDKNNWL